MSLPPARRHTHRARRAAWRMVRAALKARDEKVVRIAGNEQCVGDKCRLLVTRPLPAGRCSTAGSFQLARRRFLEHPLSIRASICWASYQGPPCCGECVAKHESQTGGGLQAIGRHGRSHRHRTPQRPHMPHPHPHLSDNRPLNRCTGVCSYSACNCSRRKAVTGRGICIFTKNCGTSTGTCTGGATHRRQQRRRLSSRTHALGATVGQLEAVLALGARGIIVPGRKYNRGKKKAVETQRGGRGRGQRQRAGPPRGALIT